MSAKPDGSGLVSNHVGNRSSHLPTVDECDEDWPPDTPLHDDHDDDDDDDVTALENPLPPPPPDAGEPRDGAPDVDGEDDIDEPMAVSSSEVTLTDTETKEALPDGPTAVMQPTDPEGAAAAAADTEELSSSTSSSDELDPTTIVRRRRDASAFLDSGVDPAAFKRRAAELGYVGDDDDDVFMDDEGWDSSEDDYVGLIPMMCSRCLRCLRRHWFEHSRAKCFLVVFNILFCICGIALVCVGLWMHLCHERLFYAVLLYDNPTSPLVVFRRVALTLFAVGCIVATLCFVGGCGAATECICFLVSHALLLLLCVLAQIVAAILYAVHQETIHTNMSTSLQYQLRHLYNKTATQSMNTSSITYRVTVVWDELQRQLECCGGLGPDDYHFSAWFNHTPDSDGSFVPLSCCGASTRDYYCQFEAMAIIQRDDKPNNIIRAQGCFDAILDWYATYRPLVAVIVIIIDILLLIDIVSSLVLARVIQRKQEEYGWRPNYYY